MRDPPAATEATKEGTRMRRLPYLAALAMMASLVMAPAALAQTRDLDCTTPGTDFGFQEEAQAVLVADPTDPNGLDADDDGVACESTTSVASGTQFEDNSSFIDDGTETASPIAEENPVATPEPAAEPTSATALPETGGPGLFLPAAAGLLLATGLIGLRVVHRHS